MVIRGQCYNIHKYMIHTNANRELVCYVHCEIVYINTCDGEKNTKQLIDMIYNDTFLKQVVYTLPISLYDK